MGANLCEVLHRRWADTGLAIFDARRNKDESTVELLVNQEDLFFAKTLSTPSSPWRNPVLLRGGIYI
jgi:hypothetical protein